MNENKIEERFDALEKKLQVFCESNQSSWSDAPSFQGYQSFELRDLGILLWINRAWVVAASFLSAFLGVLYVLSLADLYQSEGLYAPSQKVGAGDGFVSQFGGVAALAGINLSNESSSDVDQALALIKSRPFLEGVIKKHRLESYILAVSGWNRDGNELEWDRSIYDPIAQTWGASYKTKIDIPISFQAYKKLKSLLVISRDAKTNLVSISISFYSPELAKEWVELIVHELNFHFSERDRLVAERSIEYLENKISETSIADMKTVFFEVIESQTQKLMLAEIVDQYLLEVVVEPLIEAKPSQPKRIFIIAMCAFLGAVLCCLFFMLKSMLAFLTPEPDV